MSCRDVSLRLAQRTCVAVLLLSAVVAGHAQGLYAAAGPWVDDDEHAFRLDTLAGTYTVATMAYGACQQVCSTSVQRIKQLQALAEHHRIGLNFVVFGLDPAVDRPSDWAAYRAANRLPPGAVRFLTGSPAATQRIARSLGIRFWRYGEHTMHDFRIVLVSPAGQIVRALDHFDDDPALLLP